MVPAFFLCPWFNSIWSVCDTMTRNGCEQILIQSQPSCWVMNNTLFDHGLKGFQRLHFSFEAYCPLQNPVSGCGLCHVCADQIVSQGVCPDFLSNQLGRLATKL